MNAGQPAPLPIGDDRPPELAQLNGPPIGLLPVDEDYREVRLRLYGGDRFLFYTDGLVESVDARNVQFGIRRLTDAAVDQKRGIKRCNAWRILTRIHEWHGTDSLADDLAMLIIEAE